MVETSRLVLLKIGSLINFFKVMSSTVIKVPSEINIAVFRNLGLYLNSTMFVP